MKQKQTGMAATILAITTMVIITLGIAGYYIYARQGKPAGTASNQPAAVPTSLSSEDEAYGRKHVTKFDSLPADFKSEEVAFMHKVEHACLANADAIEPAPTAADASAELKAIDKAQRHFSLSSQQEDCAGGATFLYAKMDGSWKRAFVSIGLAIPCSEIAKYGFPRSVISSCASGNAVIDNPTVD